MNIKRAVWFPIAVGLIVINAAGAVYALVMSETMHAYVHGAILVGSVLWARYLRHEPPRRDERQDHKVEMLEADLSDLERQLSETQQRLDFADQLLKQKKRPE
ncbi:MAG: hypothetical protein ACT4O1_06095 [Gemmatimonadota bacterium]